ncbi:MAG TPA: cache domain-containing protein [Usitatibacter sp.]|nr:cache domain-containing protein [Usitatibacter sp.]
MKAISMMFAGLLLALGMGSAAAADHGSAAEATAMVSKAIDYMKKNGREKGYAEINNPKGQFVDRDLYVVVYDLNGKVMAHGSNAKMIGKDLIDMRDTDGKYFVKERVEIAKGKGSGWQDYKFMNPVSRKIEPKSMFLQRYEDVIVGCGIYKG